MAEHREDDLEEQEYRSLTSFEQQRYIKMMQELDKSFKDIEKKLNSDRAFLDLNNEFEPYKEEFESHMEFWKFKIMSWETRHSNKKKLASRLKDELEDHSNKYKESWTTMTVLDDEKDMEKITSY